MSAPERSREVTLVSVDGTTLQADVLGDGDPVVLVHGSGVDRAATAGVQRAFARARTVWNWDRRGRGGSAVGADVAAGGGTWSGWGLVDSAAREVEDLEAVVAAASESAGGRPPVVVGISSGANLAVRAAATGALVESLVLWEAPVLLPEKGPQMPVDFAEHLEALLRRDARDDAAELFVTTMIGLPAPVVETMRATPLWQQLVTLAHTLPRDVRVTGRTQEFLAVASTVTTPATVLDGATVPWVTAGADALAAAIPAATRATLTGQPHTVAPEVLAAHVLGTTS